MANQAPKQQREFAAPVMQAPFDALNIPAGTATTLVKTGPGMLHSVTINTKGASSNTLKIYDGVDANGTLLATIDTTVTWGPLPYDIGFQIGLTLVSATGTGADITVSYR